MKLCAECRAHLVIRDGSMCRDCTNDYLRRTNPHSGIPEWRRRTLEDQRKRGRVAVKEVALSW